MVSISKSSLMNFISNYQNGNTAQADALGNIFDKYKNCVSNNNELDGCEIELFLRAVKKKFAGLYKQVSDYIEGLKASEEVMQSDGKSDGASSVSDDVEREAPMQDFDINSNIRSDYDWDEEKFIKAFDRMVDRGRYAKRSVLKGKGLAVLKAAREHKLDPRAIIAIIMEESYRGGSDLAILKGNVGGIKRKSPGKGKWEDFTKGGKIPVNNAVNDSIQEACTILLGYYVDDNLKTTHSAAEKYCPERTDHMRSMVTSMINEFNRFYFGE